MKDYKQENNELVNYFLDKTFFRSWKRNDKTKNVITEDGNFRSVELQISPHCDLECKYCYYDKYSEHGPHNNIGLYPAKVGKRKDILNNVDMLLNWFEEKKMFPSIDLFSGELFATKLGFEVVEKCLDFFIRNKVTARPIVIPTNMTFIDDDDKVKEIERLFQKGRDNDVMILLSASIDGKYCESNRPFKDKTRNRDYDKLFAFCKKWRVLFHPMIYYEEIDKWKDNFLWFQEMFEKHDIPWDHIYLLEVRNDGWTPETVKKANEFWKFVIRWLYNKVKDGKTNEQIVEFFYKRTSLNLLNIFATCGRGIGCSIQGTVQIRMGDLVGTPCHRTSYPQFNMWKFNVEDNKIKGIEALNHELMVAIYSSKITNFPYCQDCMIKNLCTGGCLGSQYESTGDLFTPIPSVCLLEHGKVQSFIEVLEELNLLTTIIQICSHEKRTAILTFIKKFM